MQRLCRLSPDAHLFILDDEGVVLAEDRQDVVVLNSAATAVWCHIELGHGPEEIVDALQRMLGLDQVAASRELARVLDSWDGFGLLADSRPPADATPNGDAGGEPQAMAAAHAHDVPPAASTRHYALAQSTFGVGYCNAEAERLTHPVIAHLEIGPPERDADHAIEIRTGPDGGFEVHVDRQRVVPCPDASGLAPIVKAIFCMTEMDAADYFLGIHAGAVGSGGGCLLLPGSSGSGKSTLTAALCRAGYDYLSDELALLHESTFAVRPMPLGLCIKDTAWDVMAEYYPELWDRAVHQRVDGKTVRYLPPPRRNRQPADQMPVRRIIFPRYDRIAPTSLAPLSGGVALQRLLRECLTLPIDLSRRRVGELVQWIAAIPSHELRFSSLADAVALIRELDPPEA